VTPLQIAYYRNGSEMKFLSTVTGGRYWKSRLQFGMYAENGLTDEFVFIRAAEINSRNSVKLFRKEYRFSFAV